MDTAKYFCVVLGSPEQPEKNRVEEGLYQPFERSYTSYPEPGDIILFYCTGNYAGYEQQSPGIGITLYWEGKRERLRYKYLPFQAPFHRKNMVDKLEQEEQHRFHHLGIWQNWLFELSRVSAARILAEKEALLIVDDLVMVRPVRPPLDFPVDHDFGAWPDNLSLRREDMYNEWGR